MQDTIVVIDGELSLIHEGVADPSLIIPESGEFGVFTVIKDTDIPIYSGPYIVTPRAYEQVLATADKIMNDDVTVQEIPYTEVSNLSGITVSIG